MSLAREPDAQRAAMQQVYGFCDAQGVFHAFEGPFGKRLVMAMQALEDKVVARVEKTWAAKRKEMEQKSSALSWMVRNLVAEQKDLRDRLDEISVEAFESRTDLVARLQQISAEAFESRSDLIAQIRQASAADELRSDLVAHIHEVSADACEARADVIAQLEDVKRDVFEARVDTMESLEQLQKKIDMSSFASTTDSFEILAERDASTPKACHEELQHLEKQRLKINDLFGKLEEEIGVSSLIGGPKEAVNGARTSNREPEDTTMEQTVDVPKHIPSACELDLAISTSSGAVPGEGDKVTIPSPWSSRALAEVPFSSKRSPVKGHCISPFDLACPTDKFHGTKMHPLTHSFNIHRPRPVGRMASSQSMPFLEPLS